MLSKQSPVESVLAALYQSAFASSSVNSLINLPHTECHRRFRDVWMKHAMVLCLCACCFRHIYRPRDKLQMPEFAVSWLSVKDLCMDHDERHALHPHHLQINLHKAHWVSPLQHMMVGDGSGREQCRHHQIHTHSTHLPPRRGTWQILTKETSHCLLSATFIWECNWIICCTAKALTSKELVLKLVFLYLEMYPAVEKAQLRTHWPKEKKHSKLLTWANQ